MIKLWDAWDAWQYLYLSNLSKWLFRSPIYVKYTQGQWAIIILQPHKIIRALLYYTDHDWIEKTGTLEILCCKVIRNKDIKTLLKNKYFSYWISWDFWSQESITIRSTVKGIVRIMHSKTEGHHDLLISFHPIMKAYISVVYSTRKVRADFPWATSFPYIPRIADFNVGQLIRAVFHLAEKMNIFQWLNCRSRSVYLLHWFQVLRHLKQNKFHRASSEIVLNW